MITEKNIKKALYYADQLIQLAEQSEQHELYNNYAVFNGVLLDCAYKIKSQAIKIKNANMQDKLMEEE